MSQREESAAATINFDMPLLIYAIPTFFLFFLCILSRMSRVFFFFFFFPQFCDIEKFGDLFSKNKKKIKKILNQKNKKIPRISQFVFLKNTQNLVEKRNT